MVLLLPVPLLQGYCLAAHSVDSHSVAPRPTSNTTKPGIVSIFTAGHGYDFLGCQWEVYNCGRLTGHNGGVNYLLKTT